MERLIGVNDKRISSLKQQDEEYNRLYREWRQDRSNKYGYYIKDTNGEHTYQDGRGFVGDYPEADERESLEKSVTLLTQALLTYTILEFFSKLVFSDYPFGSFRGVTLLREGFPLGRDTASLFASYAENILIRLLPLVYLIFRMKLPPKLFLPMKITNRPLFICCVPVAMLTFALTYVGSQLCSAMLPMGVSGAPDFIWTQRLKPADIPVLLLYVIIIPVISEIAHRGIFLQVCRQFGDGFALALTSVISALTSIEDNPMMVFIHALMIGYFVMRTGSVLTGILMRIIMSGSYFLMGILKSPPYVSHTTLLVISIILLLYMGIGFVLLIRFVVKYSNKIGMPLYHLYLTDKEKLFFVFANPTFIIWIAIYISSTLWSIATGG